MRKVQTTNSNGEQETRWPAGDELTNLRWKMEEFLNGTLSCEEHFQTGVLKLKRKGKAVLIWSSPKFPFVTNWLFSTLKQFPVLSI